MTATELKNWQRATPFVPFDLMLPGEERLHVPHPDFISIAPTGRLAEVWGKNDERTTVDVFLVLGVQETRRPRPRNR